MAQPAAIEKFVDLMRRECPEARVAIDVPRDPKGEWMIDVSQGRFRTSVAWRSATSARSRGRARTISELVRASANTATRQASMRRSMPRILTPRAHNRKSFS